MKLRHYVASLMLSTSVALGQAAELTVVINEFAAINDSGLRDEEGNFSDWIELHNFGTKPVGLTGAALTDSRKRLAKWTLPEIKLEPGQYLVVFMSGKDRRVDRIRNQFTDPDVHRGIDFTIYNAGDFQTTDKISGVGSKTCVALNFKIKLWQYFCMFFITVLFDSRNTYTF